jgi:hypothetical protein
MSASSALGAPRCDGVAIDGAPDLLPDWALAVRQARNWMPPPASCPAFAIRVEALAHGTVRVVVTSADGRRAERSVGHPADLAPTVLGLVTSIPPEPDVSPPEAGEASRAAPVSPAETPEPRPRRVSVGRAPTEVWLSGAVGARLGEPTHAEMLDLEARADVTIRQWLLLVSFRYARGLKSGADADDQSYEETAIGVGAGRHETLGTTTLDVALVPSLATMSFDDESGSYDARGGTRSELRVGVSLRWSVALGPSWRLGITADTDVAPQGLVRSVRLDPDGAPLPAWTGGLRVSAAGALL